MVTEGLRVFVKESNGIEGIHRAPSRAEIGAHECLLARPTVATADLVECVQVIAPGKPLRDRFGMDVRVGGHIPPCGSPLVASELDALLDGVQRRLFSPWEAHTAYELLHPFMDGNGRSGRALWAWQMQRDGLDPFAMSFLRRFYYQTLDAQQVRV